MKSDRDCFTVLNVAPSMNSAGGEMHSMINDGVSKIGLEASEQQLQQWSDYLVLLERWNRTYNLTAIDDLTQMLTRHLFDSLAVAPFIQGQSIADVGSGGGLPGIPLAITFPQRSFTLVDTVAKKTRFLRQVVAELKLSNVRIEHTRVESYQPSVPFDQIISRAFTSIEDFISLTDHCLAVDGEWLAMKGKRPDEELAALGKKIAYTVYPLAIPGLDAERHLIQLTQIP